MIEDFQKALKMLTLFFISNPVLFNGQTHQKKRNLKLATNHSSGLESKKKNKKKTRIQFKLKSIPLLVMHYLTKFVDVIESGF